MTTLTHQPYQHRLYPRPSRPLLSRLHLAAHEDPPAPPAIKSLADALKLAPGLQAELDDLIEQRLARDRRGRRGDNGGDPPPLPPELDKELKDLRTYRTERERKDAEAQGNYERALKSQADAFEEEKSAWAKERDSYLADIRHDRCWGQLLASASKLGAFDPDDIATLLMNRVGIDDKRRTVVFMEDGKTPAMVKGRPMTVDELIEAHKAARPRLYKAPEGVDGDGAGGAGAQGGDGDGQDRKSKHLGGSSDLDKEIEEAETALEAARKEAASNPGSTSAISKSREARRKLEALLKKRDEARRKSA